MKLVCNSHRFKKSIYPQQKWVIVLNNYHKRSDTLAVINMPVTWCHEPSKILKNLVGQWRVKHLKEQKK